MILQWFTYLILWRVPRLSGYRGREGRESLIPLLCCIDQQIPCNMGVSRLIPDFTYLLIVVIVFLFLSLCAALLMK